MDTFAIVFSLSIDDEIFLPSRVRETGEFTHDRRESVTDGLAHRPGHHRPALTMVAAFLFFVTTGLVAIKQLAAV
jgi:hypothetical protein